MAGAFEIQSDRLSDLTGAYRTYYARRKDNPDNFGIAAIGRPFHFEADSNVTKDFSYPKEREPYKSAKQ
jgi:hypothetical protein